MLNPEALADAALDSNQTVCTKPQSRRCLLDRTEYLETPTHPLPTGLGQ